MKVLWFSNCILSDEDTKTTGTWLLSMAKILSSSDICLYNITQSSEFETISIRNCSYVKQWILPRFPIKKDGLPSLKNIEKIRNIVEEVSPDIIHIWGMESYWGLLTARNYIKGNVLLEIQGIRSSVSEYYCGGLNIRELLHCIKIRDLVRYKQSFIPLVRYYHRRHGAYEREMLRKHSNISVQSLWVESRIIPYVSLGTRLFRTAIGVRREFLECNKWNGDIIDTSQKINLFVMSAFPHPYKGIHIAIKALSILKRKYPNICLRVAGYYHYGRHSLLIPGYEKYLCRLIKKLDLCSNVTFIGPLNAKELVSEMHQCSVMIHPSFVESYSLALAEAMSVGVPCVVSYAGAMAELGEDNTSVLFYNSLDYYKCAFQIDRLLSDRLLSAEISINSRKIAIERNDKELVKKKQLEIYNTLISTK